MHILLTGATGYIGKRLIPVLLNENYKITCLIRQKERATYFTDLGCNVMIGNLLTGEGIKDVPKDIDVAYFLVHAMSDSVSDLAKQESEIALNFVKMLTFTTARQIIYLSGLANHEQLSNHLQSRVNVENIFLKSPVKTTVLRSSIIIGSGSASFEIIRDIVEKLPIMVAPKWINNRCQPISIHNVIQLLINVIDHPKCFDQIYDIGGSEIITFKNMMLKLAEFRNLKRFIFSVPVLTLRLSSLWLYFVTSTNFSLAKYLVDSMKEDSICSEEKNISSIIAINYLDFESSLNRTFSRIQENAIVSSWKDSWHLSKKSSGLSKYINVPVYGCLKNYQTFDIDNNENVKEKLWSIGGDNGWYFWTWFWQVRGFIDKLLGGVGLRRGRTHPSKINPGDALDFWRVIYANRDEGRLLLYAEMKIPGNAWIEWEIITKDNETKLVQTATFRPWGVIGRLYWYLLYIPHQFIFRGLAKQISIG